MKLSAGYRYPVALFVVLSGIDLVLFYFVQPYVAYLETTEIIHGLVGQMGFVGITIFLLVYAVYFFSRLTMQREGLLAEQAALLEEVRRLQVQAEARRQEAEARYLQAKHLQEELAREIARSRLSARYETLMREQYGKALPEFLRALLEALQEDLGFVGGVAYEVHGTQGTVVATYALPHYQGRTFSGGLPTTALTLREPYLVAISPERAPNLRGITTLRPRYVLYLPIHADVAEGGNLALLELLFMQTPPAEKVSLIGHLLPRIGNYLWMRLNPSQPQVEKYAP